MAVANAEQAELWARMAPVWAEMDDHLEKTAGPPGRMALERLDPRPGQRLLDVGCGTGPTTVDLAARVRPGGSVVGVDIAAGMLARARRRAAEGGVDNIRFVPGDVQVDDLGAARYDGAFSRFGVMFFADPVAAFANVRRALRAGGRLSFVCWQGPPANEWMLVPAAAVLSVTGGPPPTPEPGVPGPFSLGDADRVEAILAAAGFTDIDVVSHSDALGAPAAEIPDFAAAALRTGAIRQALHDADEATVRKAYDAVVDALEAHTVDGQLRLRRGVLLATATAPAPAPAQATAPPTAPPTAPAPAPATTPPRATDPGGDR